jgi:hypothetical protein
MTGHLPYCKLTVLLIGVCLFVPVIYSIHFYANRMLHRMEMWREAENKLMQTIEVDSATIHWTKKNRELIVNNEYFDVVSITYSNGKALLKGVFDKEETSMHEAFARKQNRDDEPGNATQKIADWLELQWTFEEGTDSQLVKCLLDKKFPPSSPAFSLKMGKQPPVPPPWHA